MNVMTIKCRFHMADSIRGFKIIVDLSKNLRGIFTKNHFNDKKTFMVELMTLKNYEHIFGKHYKHFF